MARLKVRVCAILAFSALVVSGSRHGHAQRVTGLDVSAWQGNWSQTLWNNIHNNDNRDFVFIRSSRGGTTGYYNQSNADNDPPTNTLSQRYDDPYFIQNITRATNAGMFAGAYHFSRPDIIASTLNSNGIANSGADEADHFIQMAGPWMRPGYLIPIHDFEAGDGVRPDQEMAQFVDDFSDRIYEVMGIRPGIYTSGNYAANVLGGASAALRQEIVTENPVLWAARWPNQSNPSSIPIQTGHPKDSYSAQYGPWDDYGITHPWRFWQYTSNGMLQSYGSRLDLNVAQGGLEFLKDHLVPALWVTNSDGQWTTVSNWNSGQTPIAPVQGPGQVARVGSLTLPAVRLPGANDTVILDRPDANIAITLNSGSHNIRKLIVREALNITGGSLNINYDPATWDSPLKPNWFDQPSGSSMINVSAQFSAPVSLTNGSLNVHTLRVDSSQTFTFGGGTLTFDAIELMRHSSTPAKIAITGDVAINPRNNAAAAINPGTGSGSTGVIDLGAGDRTVNVSDGGNAVDLIVNVPITNGGIVFAGTGTTQLKVASTYGGGTTVAGGVLQVLNASGSALGAGDVAVLSGGTLAGTGSVAGDVIVNGGGRVTPGMSAGTLAVGAAEFSSGSFLDVELAGVDAGSQHDVLNVARDAVLDGTLKVSLLDSFVPSVGNTFTVLSAESVTGVFEAISAPSLPDGVWHIDYSPTAVTLSVIAAIPLLGDFNGNGVVDETDLATWKFGLGIHGMSPEISKFLGDADEDGDVDGHDFLTWQGNAGAGATPSAAGSSAAVPEPAGSVAAIVLAMLLLLAIREQRGLQSSPGR